MQDLSDLLRASEVLLTQGCRGCITSQFANGTPVREQRACGFHDVCVIGDALKGSRDRCVAALCAVDDRCCKTGWGPECIALVQKACDRTCTPCAHELCEEGESLRRTCGEDECAAQVCAKDPYCCDTAWDDTCVLEASEICNCTPPDTTEVCNGIDDDKDGQIDEDVKRTFYEDADGDGHGNPLKSMLACDAPTGYLSDTTDCDDSNADVRPGAADESCDGVDEDCDGSADDEYKVDDSCFLPGVCASGNVASSCTGGQEKKCETGTPSSEKDESCDGVDEDCDGSADDEYKVDDSCFLPGVCATGNVASSCTGGQEKKCETGTPSSEKDESCDGVDEDCDGSADDEYKPDDSCFEAFGVCAAGNLASSCEAGHEMLCHAGLPSDTAETVCNGLDDDCDGKIDEGFRPAAITCGACNAAGVTTCSGGQSGDNCAAVCAP